MYSTRAPRHVKNKIKISNHKNSISKKLCCDEDLIRINGNN